MLHKSVKNTWYILKAKKALGSLLNGLGELNNELSVCIISLCISGIFQGVHQLVVGILLLHIGRACFGSYRKVCMIYL